MATNSYFTQGTTGEQDLVGDLVVEQIKMFGKDVYYIPRTLVNEDTVFGEDNLSSFNGAYLIEAYIEDANEISVVMETCLVNSELESPTKLHSLFHALGLLRQ